MMKLILVFIVFGLVLLTFLHTGCAPQSAPGVVVDSGAEQDSDTPDEPSCSDGPGDSSSDGPGDSSSDGPDDSNSDGPDDSNSDGPDDDSTDSAQEGEPSVGFPGAGTAGAGDPLEPGLGPETASQCAADGSVEPSGVEDTDTVEPTMDCFYSEDDSTPAAAIEQVVETVDDIERIHIRLTLNPGFVDNTFGDSSIGWEDAKNDKHTLRDLVGSDHAEMKLLDSLGNLVLRFKLDYLSEIPGDKSPSGYGTRGVSGGDGAMIEGDESAILGVATSLDRNLNGCGFDEYIKSSPVTDENYTPDPNAPQWDYRVVYEVWVDTAPFGEAGFGKSLIETVHATPSKKGENTLLVVEGECPEDDKATDGEEDYDDPWTDTPS